MNFDELEDYVDILLSPKGFIFEYLSGAVLPVNHPNYKSSITEIKLYDESDMENVALINGEEKRVTMEMVEQIKNLCRENFQALYEISLKLDSNMVGGYKVLHIKLDSIILTMDLLGVANDDKRIIDNFLEKIMNCIN